MATGYAYSPLDTHHRQTRVLCFDLAHEPRDDELLDCRIEHITLGTLRWPVYYAISYVWGAATKRSSLRINGQLVSVPENAEHALRRLYRRAQNFKCTLSSNEGVVARNWPSPRLVMKGASHLKRVRRTVAHTRKRSTSQEPVRIWIDAICIDQSNLIERSEQVALMQHIYAKAAAVLIWLGEDVAVSYTHLTLPTKRIV